MALRQGGTLSQVLLVIVPLFAITFIADPEILILEDGDVIKQRNHAEFLETNGSDALSCRAQFAGQ